MHAFGLGGKVRTCKKSYMQTPPRKDRIDNRQKNALQLLLDEAKSLIHTVWSKGPKMEPCGIPWETLSYTVYISNNQSQKSTLKTVLCINLTSQLALRC